MHYTIRVVKKNFNTTPMFFGSPFHAQFQPIKHDIITTNVLQKQGTVVCLTGTSSPVVIPTFASKTENVTEGFAVRLL